MQIYNTTQVSSQPNFKQLNLVKVDKSFFTKETPIHFKDNIMKSFLDLISRNKKGPLKKLFLAMIGLRKKAINFFSFLEFPGYASIMQKADELGVGYSWFKQNSGIDFKDPMDEQYDSFWILTKKDKDDYIDATPKSEMKELMFNLFADLKEKEQKGEPISKTFIVAQTAKWMNEKFEQSIKGKEIKEIILDDDYQIENLEKDLDL